jgi:C1A family cysteine protease
MNKTLVFITLLLAFVLSENNAFAVKVSHKKKSYSTKHYKHKHSLGLKRDAAKHKAFIEKAHKLQLQKDAVIPSTLDLSAKISPPEDQGQCGACWAFSITKALRSAMMLANNDPGVLAFNYLVDNCGGVTNEYACNGGDFDAGQNMLSSKGPWLESQDPYQARRTRCANGLATKGTALSWNVVGDGNTRPSFKLLAGAIAEGHVLSVDVDAESGDWANYSGGIYDTDAGHSIDHMINLVGYNCETSKDASGNCVFDSSGKPVNGDGYLILMNNWGTTWGEKGYMRSRWGMNAIAETAMYFEVVQPAPPVPVPPVPTPPVPVPPAPVPSGSSIWIIIGVGVLALIGIAIGAIGLIALLEKKNKKIPPTV